MTRESQMLREIRQIPQAARRLLENQDGILAAAEMLRAAAPCVLVTIARGSSDHAAAYVKYAFEITAGLPVCSIGPSVASVYKARLKLDHAVAIAISQSGKSPDIASMSRAALEGGAPVIAITNGKTTPLAGISSRAIDILAGPERSVAATKTFVSSVIAGLLLLAHWRDDASLLAALNRLPERLEAALALDWSAMLPALMSASSLYVLGRGPGYAAAREMALKFKEVCRIPAHAYSSAEVLHGPVSIVGPGFPVLTLAVDDAARPGIVEEAAGLAGRGAEVFITSPGAKGAHVLPALPPDNGLTAPLELIVPFYTFAEALARRKGLDPDNPRNLRKVTQTL